jgi:hypothetical protein
MGLFSIFLLSGHESFSPDLIHHALYQPSERLTHGVIAGHSRPEDGVASARL